MGIILLVAGFGCLSWIAFQLFVTNFLAEQYYRQEKQAVRLEWQRSGSRSLPSPPGTSALSTAGAADVVGLLRIPSFGAGYEVPILQGTSAETLARGVGHYQGTALPGQIGNFALAGHRITHGEPFAKLLDLKKGAHVVVETRDFVFTYVIDAPPRQLTVPDTAGWVLDPVPGHPGAPAGKALITLTTCHDLFHSPTRSIGFGHLVDATRQSP